LVKKEEATSMRRDTLREAVSVVVKDLTETGMGEMFTEAVGRVRPSAKEEGRQDWLDFEVYQEFLIRTHQYNEAERKVLSIVELDVLLASSFWQTLTSNPDRSALFGVSQSIRFAVNHLPKLISLLARDYPSPEMLLADDSPQEYANKDMIRLILAEENQQFSSTERLILALTSIQTLYNVINEVNSIKPEKLLVLGMDSGSEKLFDILGLASAISEAKELILGLFDRLVFFRNAAASKNMSTIAESLPIFQKIAELEKREAISREEIELLRRKVVMSLENFVDSGALIPEMKGSVVADPLIIMRPQPKLLSGPMDIESSKLDKEPDEAGGNPSGRSELSSNEQEELTRLLRKAGYAPARSATRRKVGRRKPVKS
jgi:hypothetical protein